MPFKIQRGAENTLNTVEKKSVAHKINFLIGCILHDKTAMGSTKVATKSNYASLNKVSATSNVVNRLF